MPVFTISCDECRMQHTATCAECVVSFICDRDATAVVADVAEVRALKLLERTGLVPPLRHQLRTGDRRECG
jgi:hypothetical protein